MTTPSKLVRQGLSANASILFSEIEKDCKKNGICSKTNRELGLLLGLGKRQGQRILRELEDTGYISCVYNNPHPLTDSIERVITLQV